MTSIKKNALAVCALVLLGCAAMTVVDGVLRPPYAVKSAVKLTLFLLAPLLYEYTAGRDGHRALFRIQRRALLRALALGLGVFALILGAYFALRGIFDFSAVTALLDKNAGVTAENFLWVSLYVSFVNSLRLCLPRPAQVRGRALCLPFQRAELCALPHGDDARVVFSASFSSRTRGACRGRRTF